MTTGYQALREGAAWLDLSTRGRIEAKGRDRARFLHNLTSNDVKAMQPGTNCYAFLLTAQGRIVADVNLLCLEDRFLLDLEPEQTAKVLAHVLKYKVADQVEFTDITATTSAFGVEGPAAVQPPAGVTAAPFTITGQPGYRIYCAPDEMADIIRGLESAGVTPATADDARAVRIENGKPRYGEDILETSLPQETRQMHAVSFNKGCYLGQEIVERIRARGHVNRELLAFSLDADEPPVPGAKLVIDGRETEVTSAIVSPRTGKVAALGYARVSARP